MPNVRIKRSEVKQLKELKDKAVSRALTAIGMTAEGYAKDYETAIDTGRLRNSITYVTKDYPGAGTYTDNQGGAYADAVGKGVPKKGTVVIGTNVEYAQYIEDGHHSYPGVHFLRNAVADHQDEYAKLIEDSLKNA